MAWRIGVLAMIASFAADARAAVGEPKRIGPPPKTLDEPAPREAPVPHAKTPNATRYLHDGFYLRFAGGFHHALFWGTHDGEPASLNGLGPGLALFMGGTPARGLVIGGTFGFAGAEGDFQGAASEGDEEEAGIAPLIGAFIDVYTDPRGPWHLGAAAGLGGYSLRDSGGTSYVGLAPALSLFAGYDVWLSAEWSGGLGIMLQGSAPARAANEAGELGYRMAAFSSGFQSSFVWH